MDTDERVRKEIDRKARVEQLKTLNQGQMLTSAARVKKSQSPTRQAYA